MGRSAVVALIVLMVLSGCSRVEVSITTYRPDGSREYEAAATSRFTWLDRWLEIEYDPATGRFVYRRVDNEKATESVKILSDALARMVDLYIHAAVPGIPTVPTVPKGATR